MKRLRRRAELESVQFGSLSKVPDRAEEWLTAGTMLHRLRLLAPGRPMTAEEGLAVAERQAARPLAGLGGGSGPVPVEALSQLSRIEVAYVANIPVAGASVWGGGAWRVTVEAKLPLADRRMVVAHEFKHVLDYTVDHDRYLDDAYREPLADYFARCLFMP